MKNVLFLISIVTMLASCSDPKLEKVEALKKECIAIHDEVMPRMGGMVELSTGIKGLRSKLDSDTTDSAQLLRVMLVRKVELLDSAHEAMLVWMDEYVTDYELEHTSDEAITFYEGKKVSISEVKDIMLKSIEDGKETIQDAN